MKKKVKKWLEDGTVDVFLGYKMVHGHPLPHCFTLEDVAEVDELIVSEARYSLEKIATHLSREDPEIKIGLLARDCNQRAINVLSVWHQLDLEKIKTLNVNCCPSNLTAHPDCSYMTAETPGAYKQQVGIDNTIDTETADAFSNDAGCMSFRNASNVMAAAISARFVSVRNVHWNTRISSAQAICRHRCQFFIWCGQRIWPGVVSTVVCVKTPAPWISLCAFSTVRLTA